MESSSILSYVLGHMYREIMSTRKTISICIHSFAYCFELCIKTQTPIALQKALKRDRIYNMILEKMFSGIYL